LLLRGLIEAACDRVEAKPLAQGSVTPEKPALSQYRDDLGGEYGKLRRQDRWREVESVCCA